MPGQKEEPTSRWTVLVFSETALDVMRVPAAGLTLAIALGDKIKLAKGETSVGVLS